MIWSQLFVIGRARRRLRASRSSYDLPLRVGALGAALRPPAPLIAGLVGQGDEAVTPAARRLRGLALLVEADVRDGRPIPDRPDKSRPSPHFHPDG